MEERGPQPGQFGGTRLAAHLTCSVLTWSMGHFTRWVHTTSW